MGRGGVGECFLLVGVFVVGWANAYNQAIVGWRSDFEPYGVCWLRTFNNRAACQFRLNFFVGRPCIVEVSF